MDKKKLFNTFHLEINLSKFNKWIKHFISPFPSLPVIGKLFILKA